MEDYTHQKRPYRAKCVRWDGSNLDEIAALLPPPINLTIHNGGLMMRLSPGVIHTMYPGHWAVKGENGTVKIYTTEEFETKYQSL